MAVDNDAVESVAFLIDGVEIGKDSAPPYELHWEIACWAYGDNHSIMAKATDAEGNIGLSDLVAARISSTLRISLEVIEPAEDSIFTVNSPVTFAWYKIDCPFQYELEISPSYKFIDDVTSYVVPETTITVAALDIGTYYWRVRGLSGPGGGTDWSEVRRFYLVTNLSDVLVFTEYESNPVVSWGDYYWNNQHSVWPSVIYDNGLFKMWFSGLGGGQYSIGYAISVDGINWEIRAEPVLEPIVTENTVEVFLREPFVIKVESGYRMYYTARNSTGLFQIFLATSTDGVTWERYSSEPVLGVGEPGEFDYGYVGTSPIIIHEGTYFMWYNGGSGLYENKSVGLATSQDGLSWVKNSASPVFETDSVADMGMHSIGVNSIYLLPNGRFEMLYHGNDGLGRFVNRAWSSDGIIWSRDPFNPLISPGGQHAWNEFSSSSACALRQGDIYQIWFSGESRYGWSIGYGTARLME